MTSGDVPHKDGAVVVASAKRRGDERQLAARILQKKQKRPPCEDRF